MRQMHQFCKMYIKWGIAEEKSRVEMRDESNHAAAQPCISSTLKPEKNYQRVATPSSKTK